MRHYQIYGITIATDYEFSTPLRESRSHVSDVTLDVRNARDTLNLMLSSKPSYVEQDAKFYRTPGAQWLVFPTVAYSFAGQNEITAYLRDPDKPHMVEIGFLGTVLAYWLERRGVTVLHGSAVDASDPGDEAVAFVGPSGSGKSVLASAMFRGDMGQLLTDELLVVSKVNDTWYAYPGASCMWLDPEWAKEFDSEWITNVPWSKRVRLDGDVCDVPLKLKRIYCIRNGVGYPIIKPQTRYSAIRSLVAASYMPRVSVVLRNQRTRLGRLQSLSDDVPVKTLGIGRGDDYLWSLNGRVRSDLEGKPVAKRRNMFGVEID